MGEKKWGDVLKKRERGTKWGYGRQSKMVERLSKIKTSFKVGFGNEVKFWKDRWCEDMTLRDFVLDLYFIASSKDAWVIDAWDDGSWGPRFIRQLHDWELEEVGVFFGRLYDHSICLGNDDIMVWLETKNDNFSLKAF